MSREDPHFRLRLPEEEKEFIRAQAAKNRRSITGEIITVLAKHREQVMAEQASNGDAPPSPHRTAARQGSNSHQPG